MAQLHCYVPEAIARQAQFRAAQAGVSVSRYLAELVKRDAGEGWPEGYFELFGQWQGEPLVRPDQWVVEERLAFK